MERVAELTGGIGAELVFETAGSPYTAAQTSGLVCRGGRIVMVGNIVKEVPYSFRNIYLKEATIYSVFRYCDCFPYAIDAVSRGRIDIQKIATDIWTNVRTAAGSMGRCGMWTRCCPRRSWSRQRHCMTR